MALEPTVLIPEKSLLPTNHTPDSSPFTSLTTARGPRGPFKTQEVGIIIPFAKEKTEAQRGAVGCPGSHFQERQGSLLVPALAPVGKASMTSHDKPSAVDSVCVCVRVSSSLSHAQTGLGREAPQQSRPPTSSFFCPPCIWPGAVLSCPGRVVPALLGEPVAPSLARSRPQSPHV